MKVFYIPALLFLCSCTPRAGQDDTLEKTNMKIKVLKARGDSVEKANVDRRKENN